MFEKLIRSLKYDFYVRPLDSTRMLMGIISLVAGIGVHIAIDTGVGKTYVGDSFIIDLATISGILNIYYGSSFSTVTFVRSIFIKRFFCAVACILNAWFFIWMSVQFWMNDAPVVLTSTYIILSYFALLIINQNIVDREK